MLISHFWYTLNFESSYKKSSFIKVAVFFFWCYFSIKISDLQSKGETIKLLPCYLYDRYLQNCKNTTFEKITKRLKYK